ncbi:MAG TPA: hypothetical protein VMV05_12015 [bacterium]|nr:hypothetical protein [bacterium]
MEPLMDHRPRPFPVPLSPLAVSLLISFFLFAASFFLFRPYYMTGDDPLMAGMVQGAGSDKGTEFLLFTNSLLGLALKWLYIALPGLEWYGYFHLFVFALSMGVLIHLLLSGRFQGLRFFLFLAVFTNEFFHYFLHFHYTLNAFWAGTAGIFLLASALHGRRSPSWHALAVTLLLLSGLIRLEATAMSAVLCLPFVLREGLLADPRELRKVLKTFGLAVLGLLSIWLWDKIDYHAHPEWAGARPFVEAHNELVEYRLLPASPQLDSILKSADWTPLDLAMFEHWFWQGSIFTFENLKRIQLEFGPAYSYKGWGWLELFHFNYMYLCFGLAALFFFFLPLKKYFLYLLNFLLVFAVFFHLYYFEKTSGWLVWPLFSYLSIIGLYYSNPDESFWSTKFGREKILRAGVQWALVVLWITLWLPGMAVERKLNQASITREENLKEDLKNLAPRRDQLYVVWPTMGGFPENGLGLLGDYRIFKDCPMFTLNWGQNTPWAQGMLRRFGIKDLAPDMVDRKDVFFILPKNFLDLYAAYLWQHYRIKSRFTWVFHGKTFDAYQVARADAS